MHLPSYHQKCHPQCVWFKDVTHYKPSGFSQMFYQAGWILANVLPSQVDSRKSGAKPSEFWRNLLRSRVDSRQTFISQTDSLQVFFSYQKVSCPQYSFSNVGRYPRKGNWRYFLPYVGRYPNKGNWRYFLSSVGRYPSKGNWQYFLSYVGLYPNKGDWRYFLSYVGHYPNKDNWRCFLSYVGHYPSKDNWRYPCCMSVVTPVKVIDSIHFRMWVITPVKVIDSFFSSPVILISFVPRSVYVHRFCICCMAFSSISIGQNWCT